MKAKPMLSGSQLRQYLHISTRKLKYLMDHNYIPHEDTGQATYRYRVRWEDAVAFKQRMDTDCPPSRIDGQKETRYNGKEGRQRR